MIMKIYKCYDKHGSYRLLFSHNGISFTDNSLGNGKAIYSDELVKIEIFKTNTQVDTLQEVVDYAMEQKENSHFANEVQPNIYIEVGRYAFDSMYKEELLTHIRKPKLKEITPQQLAEMGYKMKEL